MSAHGKMTGRIAAEGVGAFTKAGCKGCGHSRCSAIRKWTRRSAKRDKRAQAERAEARSYLSR